MSSFDLWGGGSINSLFGSSNSMSTFLTDYASIKNGSYLKLMKAYYGGDNNVSSRVSDSTATSKDSAKKLTSVQDAANDLKEAADALNTTGSKSVFNKKKVEKEDGTVAEEYDVNAIYKKVNQFVTSYNDLLKSTDSVSSDSLNRALKNLISTSKANSSMLRDIGILVHSDGSLTIAEDTFKEADMEKVKSLFSGKNSYGTQISARASMVDYAAQREASKANTYNKYGSYNYNYNYSYNSYF